MRKGLQLLYYLLMLRIRIRDPVLFEPWFRDPGWKDLATDLVKATNITPALDLNRRISPDPGSKIRDKHLYDHISES